MKQTVAYKTSKNKNTKNQFEVQNSKFFILNLQLDFSLQSRITSHHHITWRIQKQASKGLCF